MTANRAECKAKEDALEGLSAAGVDCPSLALPEPVSVVDPDPEPPVPASAALV
jgi:hypothetical protein